MHTALASVVIPVKDRPESLLRSVRSVLAQSHNRVQVVVVENNSSDPDSINKVLEELADSRIVVHHLDECSNANVARNHGARHSDGDYVLFLDSDDVFLPDHVENCLSLLTQESADFVYGSMLVNDGTQEQVRAARPLHPGETGLRYLFGPEPGWAQTSSYALTREAARKLRWDESLARHQDFDFFIRAVSQLKTTVNPRPDIRVFWLKGEKRVYDAASMRTFYIRWRGAMTRTERVRFCYIKVKDAVKNLDIKGIVYFSARIIIDALPV